MEHKWYRRRKCVSYNYRHLGENEVYITWNCINQGDDCFFALPVQERIGWREGARHFLVYSSDSSFHIAGDAAVSYFTVFPIKNL